LLIKKILLIMWNERYDAPLRIVAKSYARYKKHGHSGMVQRLEKEYGKLNLSAVNHLGKSSDYARWIARTETNIQDAVALTYNPLISIITPTYNTDVKYLTQMLDSVLAQTYTSWELCIADDASTDEQTKKTLEKYTKKYENIKVVYREENGHISEASNSALTLATGEYVAFLDHDDTLAPNALHEMVVKLNDNRKLKFIYSDEDKIDENNNRYNPHFKSGWNPDMFFSQNYITHFAMIKKELVEKVGGFRKGYEGSQDYDLFLRVIGEISDEEITHVEKILYHWRAIKGSTAYGSGEKNYAHSAGLRALQDYFTAQHIDAVVEDGMLPNTYKVNYALTKTPLVSLLIPTLILDNETSCPKTLNYFEKLKQYSQIRILPYHYPFNYSAINNYGVEHAQGEVVGLINNDVEVISKGWLKEMLQYAMREDIGAVGAMLYYDNETIQHAGVVLGIGGVAGHSHKYFKKGSEGYFSRLKIVQNYSAVTGACLLVRKKLYKEVGGLDEANLQVAFNDVDFCLKLQEKGYRNLWTPYAELYHHESVSRGAEDNPQKVARFNKEVDYMKTRYFNALQVDKMYNLNLTKKHENFGLNIDE